MTTLTLTPIAVTSLTPVVSAPAVYDVTDYGAIGNGTTDDRAAIQLALDAAIAGGIVFFPRGTYRVVTTAVSLTVPTLVTLLGEGEGLSILKSPASPTGVPFAMIAPATDGALITLSHLTLDGNTPGTYPNVQTLIKARANMTSGSRITLEHVTLKNGLFGVHVPEAAAGSVVDLYLRDCTLTGLSATAAPSMGIDHHGSNGLVHIRGGTFSAFGLVADGHNHSIYIGSAVDLDVEGVLFGTNIGTGNSILHYYKRTAETQCDVSRIVNCTFLSHGISGLEARGCRTEIVNCNFVAFPRAAVTCKGEVLISGGSIEGAAATVLIYTSPGDVTGDGFATPRSSLDVVGVVFTGTNSDSTIELNGTNTDCQITGCRFNETTAAQHVRTRASGIVVRMGYNLIESSSTNIAVYMDPAVAAPRSLEFFCNYVNEASSVLYSGGTAHAQYVVGNNFRLGTAVAGSTPTTKLYRSNYGAIGLADS